MGISLAKNQDWIITQNEAAADGATAPVWLQDTMPASDDRHEAVLFIKPELTELGSGKIPAFLKMVDAACSRFDVEIMNVGVLGYSYMKEHNIAGDHYGVINKISREGFSALAPDAQAKLRELFPAASEDNIIGAHQFLARFPDWTAEKLGEYVDNNPSSMKKLAPGTYAQPIQQDSTDYVLLSGFHPQQLLHFENPGRTIIVCPVRSRTSWKNLRDEMVGATDPTTAPAGALRADLLANKDSLGIPTVSKGLNGIHLSAGPLEGMVELVRFASDRTAGNSIDYADTNFGKAYLASGASADELLGLAQNPMVDAGGKTQSAFDATELMDMSEAVSTLKTAPRKAA